VFNRLPIPFKYIIGAGVLLSFIFSLKAVIPYLYWGELELFSWHRMALPHIINYLFWPFLVPMIYWTFLNYRLSKEAVLNERLVTIGMSLLIPLVHELITTIIYFFFLDVFDIYTFQTDTWSQLMAAFPGVYLGRVVEFWIIYGLFASFDYYKRYRDKQAELGRIEAQLTRTKLDVLRMQLQPHFLFNALNTISSLMDEDVKKAQRVTARLGDLLRGILEKDNRIFVTLEEELDYVKTYLEIECVRFGDRLTVRYEVDDALLAEKLPLLIIQPLAENAVKHGVARMTRNGVILVSTRMEGDKMHITVEDNGGGQSRNTQALFKQGIGLQNIQERLKALYKGAAQMLISTGHDRGFKVELIIPKARMT
jgi:sensor histidine kinase YesM